MPELDELLTRQMPHSDAAEQAVLGAMLIDSRCIPQVVEALRPEDFYTKQHIEVYEAIYSMFSLSKKIDPVTVQEQMRADGTYSEENTRGFLLQLMEVTPTAANVMEYVEIVRDKALLRRVAETAGDLSSLVNEGTATGTEMLEVAEQRIYAIRQGRAFQGLTPVSAITADVYARIGELAEAGSAVPGTSTGLLDLDRMIGGLGNSDLVLLAARLFFSLEMSREQLVTRLISSESFLPNTKLTTGQLEEDDWEKLTLACRSLNATTILIDDNPSLSVADMNAKCRRVENLGLVVIDYLQLMTSAGGKQNYSGENRQQVVSDISRALKIMAKELNVPVLCLSQLSRANESRSDKRPMLSDLRESGAIEQDADEVMFIYRDDYYNEDSEFKNQAEIIVAKNRHGETGKVMVQWLPEFTTFANLEWKHQD